MKKIITTTEILDLRGKTIPKDEEGSLLKIKDVLPDVILAYKIGGSMKKLLVAERIAKEDEVSLDDADFNLVKSAVLSEEFNIYPHSSVMNNLVQGRLEQYLLSVESEKTKENK